jgi:hypothetical protein
MEAGALISYGFDLMGLFYDIASYVHQIARGAKPADMPIEQSPRFYMAWTPVQGASSYRIWRAGADNVFRTIGETQGPSYGDHGLAPATPYAWQVTAVVGGIEQPPSPSARASTRPTPPRCDTPGSCQ